MKDFMVCGGQNSIKINATFLYGTINEVNSYKNS